MRRSLRALGTLLSMAVRADPARAAGVFGVTVVEAGIRALFPLWMKVLIDGAVRGSLAGVTVAASAYAGSVLALGLLNLARLNWGQVLAERTRFLIDQRIITLVTGIPTLEHHERPDLRDEIELLGSTRSGLGGTVNAVVSNVLIFVQLGGSVALLGSVHPVLLTVPLFGLPSLWAGSRSAALEQRAREETAETIRGARHVFELATSPGPGKELRIFGLGPELVERHRALWRELDRRQRSADARAALLAAAGWSVFALGYVGALTFVVLRAVHHPATTSIGDVVMAFSIAGQLNGSIEGAAATARWLSSSLKTIGRYLKLADYAEAARPRPDDPAPVPERIERGIDLEGVTFRYPGTEPDVLRDVTLHFPAGSTVAIVGENGAGKTTLVKLLARFYTPTSGRVALDGIDLQRLDVEEWRARTAGGFQDFARFEFLARETVGVGDLPLIEDAPSISAALERASAGDVVPTFPSGLETQLGKSFEGGVEPSIGQWQKLALGRALMREAPLLLMLDEPTASLDAETEHALFERYAGAARRVAATNGAITVLVSHRFSTVRMADLVVVLDGGRVVEAGRHEELMARGGLYAELFSIQARAYRS